MSAQPLSDFAKQVYNAASNPREDARIFRSVQDSDPSLETLRIEKFSKEYLYARLAVAAWAWEQACIENGYEAEGDRKVMIKVVLNIFNTPDMTNEAAVFSSYVYDEGPDAQGSPVARLGGRLYCRLIDLEDLTTITSVPPAVEVIVAALEGLRSALVNQISDFLIENLARGAKDKRKRT